MFSLMVEIEDETVSERIKEGSRESSWSVRAIPIWILR